MPINKPVFDYNVDKILMVTSFDFFVCGQYPGGGTLPYLKVVGNFRVIGPVVGNFRVIGPFLTFSNPSVSLYYGQLNFIDPFFLQKKYVLYRI